VGGPLAPLLVLVSPPPMFTCKSHFGPLLISTSSSCFVAVSGAPVQQQLSWCASMRRFRLKESLSFSISYQLNFVVCYAFLEGKWYHNS
jgi:hypothetical protein